MSWQKILAMLSAGLGAAAVSLPSGPIAIVVGVAAAASAAGAAAFSHSADKVAAVDAAVHAAAKQAAVSIPQAHPAQQVLKVVLAATNDDPPTGA
jgi:drug/metabolite transporter (DMT)-like permease